MQGRPLDHGGPSLKMTLLLTGSHGCRPGLLGCPGCPNRETLDLNVQSKLCTKCETLDFNGESKPRSKCETPGLNVIPALVGALLPTGSHGCDYQPWSAHFRSQGRTDATPRPRSVQISLRVSSIGLRKCHGRASTKTSKFLIENDRF